MNGDDLILRDGESYTNGIYYPEAPQEQVQEEVEAKGIQASSYPIMDKVADWFDDAILECDSVSNIEMTEQEINGVKYSRKVSIEGQVFAYQLLKTLLEDKRKEFGEFGEGRS